MSDLIFKPDRIPFPSPGTKCPETKLEIKMTETDISKVLIEGEYATIMGVKYKRVEEPKTPVEEAYKEWWGQYPELETDSQYDDMRWQGFRAGYELAQPKAVPVEEPKPRMEYQESGTVDKVEYNGHTYLRIDYDDDGRFGGVWWKQIERHKSPMNIVTDDETRNILEGLWYNQVYDQVKKEDLKKPMDEVVDRLENKYKDAEKNSASYMTGEVVERVMKKWEENPPSFLRFELGKTLEDLISRWWLDIHTDHKDWDVPTCVDDLVDQIQLWLPREQSHEGTQDSSVIDLVDGYNDALTKIKSKLRNKK